jgi:hypothetical protein
VGRHEQVDGGWGEIRTHGTLAGTPVFKTGALNHSATHPSFANIELLRRSKEQIQQAAALCGVNPLEAPLGCTLEASMRINVVTDGIKLGDRIEKRSWAHAVTTNADTFVRIL